MKKYLIISLAIILLILLGYFFGGRKIVDTYPIEVLQQEWSVTSTPTTSTNQEKGEVERDLVTMTVD